VYSGIETREQRGEEERGPEARIPSAAGFPGFQEPRLADALRLDPGSDRLPTLGVRVEQPARPVGRRHRARDEVRDRGRLVLDDRFLLRRERGRRLGVVATVNMHGEAAFGDPGQDLDLGLERHDPHLREPEAVLLDEVEGDPIAPGRARRADRQVQRQGFAGRDRSAQRGAQSVPVNGVAERVEPVVRELHALAASRAPRRRPGVLHPHARASERPGTGRLELVREPANGERAYRHRVIANRLHSPSLRGLRGYASAVPAPLLVRTLRREPVERTPVWFMRQAGRSLPEYRALRERHSFFELAGTPELCAEVTLQPVRRHDVDAAVLFADIMTPVLAMGVDVRLVEGVGPVVDKPIRSRRDVERLQPLDESSLAPVFEAVRTVRAALPAEKALVGFCGGPFTVAGYLVEGRPSRDLNRTKALMLAEPETWALLLERLATAFARYVQLTAAAGADAIQLFDSWVGVLSPAHYGTHVAPWSARVLAAAAAPTIHFGTGTAGLLEAMADAGGDAIGLDWRVRLDEAWDRLPGRAMQGNLDPAALLAPWSVVEQEAADVLARAGGRPGHVFNLGHGVLPETDPGMLTRLAALVGERTAQPVPA
jgi:uroporphyrinogen decarboxylase